MTEDPQDSKGNLSRPRACINMNPLALSPAFTWVSPGRGGLVVGCLYLDIERQSWLVDNVDRGLMQLDELRRLTKKQRQKQNKNVLSPQRRYENLVSKMPKKIGFFSFNIASPNSIGLSICYTVDRGLTPCLAAPVH